MNFFNVLQRDNVNVAEIADSIVALEKEQPAMEVKLAECKNGAMKIRKKKLGGGVVSENEISEADKAFKDAELNLEASNSALQDLKVKLRSAIEKSRVVKEKGLQETEKILKREAEELLKEIYETAAKLSALQACYGGGNGNLELVCLNIFDAPDTQKQIYKVAVEKFLNNQKEPRYCQKKAQADEDMRNLLNFDIDSEETKLLADANERNR